MPHPLDYRPPQPPRGMHPLVHWALLFASLLTFFIALVILSLAA